MSLSDLVNSFPNNKGNLRKHNNMVARLNDYLQDNTDVLRTYLHFEMGEDSLFGMLKVGEIDLLAIYEDKIEIYEVKSKDKWSARMKARYQLKKAYNFVTRNMVGCNIDLIYVAPGHISRLVETVEVDEFNWIVPSF